MLIIADIGINFNGNLALAHNLIREAAMCGADIAKFQLYSPEKLFGKNGEDPNEEVYQAVKHTELKKEDVTVKNGLIMSIGQNSRLIEAEKKEIQKNTEHIENIKKETLDLVEKYRNFKRPLWKAGRLLARRRRAGQKKEKN